MGEWGTARAGGDSDRPKGAEGVKNVERNDWLKLLACLLMLIDHVGYLFFPDLLALRAVGRLAFPIFAWQIARGYRHTSHLGRYMGRLFVFALLSQIPYRWFSPGRLNILPTLLAGLWVLWLSDRGGKKGLLYAGLLVAMGDVLHLQYGSYGLAMIWIFHLYGKDRGKTTLAYVLMSLFFVWLDGFSDSMLFQSLSVWALFLIYADWPFQIRLNRYFFYVFYPGHIAFLLLVRALL